MARINIDDELRADPRFTAICSLVPRHIAFGALCCLWELGQAYWKRNCALIPHKLAEHLPNITELISSDFVEKRENGYYCSGAEERWAFLLAKSKAGKKSAEMRFRKYGTSAPQNATNKMESVEQTSEQKPNRTEPSSSSSSSSSSSNKNYSSSSSEEAAKVYAAVQRYGPHESDEIKKFIGQELFDLVIRSGGWSRIREMKRDHWLITNISKQIQQAKDLEAHERN